MGRAGLAGTADRLRGAGAMILALTPFGLWAVATTAVSRSGLAMVAAVGGVALAVGGCLVVGDRARRRLGTRSRWALDGLLLGIGLLSAGWLGPRAAIDQLTETFDAGRADETRVLRHQVWAAYRRMDLDGQAKILERARVYVPTILEAAREFGVDAEVMVGVAATESSFFPRDSKDGGRGLFQITAVPAEAREAARRRLGVAALDPVNPRHDAFVAAATLALYREQVGGDLFLTLLAYNIGPGNGGLRSILRQYNARSFVQAQPYLQSLPREYPVRVLSSAVAFRVWRMRGGLPRYEQGRTALDLQQLGVPGLDPAPDLDGGRSGLPAS